MLKNAPQTPFLDGIVMVGVAVGPFELKFERVALTFRGGCDANAPECPNKLCCEIGSL